MADSKLTELEALASPSDDDIIYIVDSPGDSPLSRKMAMSALKTFVRASTSKTATFTNANLVAGVYTFNHALNQQLVNVMVYSNNYEQVTPDGITLTDANNSAIDLTSFGALTGTWMVIANA